MARSARPVRYAHGAVNVRSAPRTSGARVAQLAQGDVVRLEACEGGWCRVAPDAPGTWTEGYVSEPLLHASAATGPASARRGQTASRSSGSSRSSSSARASGPSAVCSDYATQSAAQTAYNRDPVGLSELDGDADGEACETQFRSTRTRSTARSRTRSRAAAAPTCYTGPRGGRYYYNSRGNKVYGC